MSLEPEIGARTPPAASATRTRIRPSVGAPSTHPHPVVGPMPWPGSPPGRRPWNSDASMAGTPAVRTSTRMEAPRLARPA